MPVPLPPPHVGVSLRRLFPSASFVGCADLCVRAASHDSREIRPGMLFAALRGSTADGHDYSAAAAMAGAAALLVERPQPVRLPQCVVPDTRSAFAVLCEALAGQPSAQLKVAGVTGTNGKTTITWLIRAILNSAGRRCGLLGTIEYDDSVEKQPSQLTTPDPVRTSAWLSRMVQARASHAAMELSSHALDQDRVCGVRLEAAVISNITQDHFDYHGTFDAYRAAKMRITRMIAPGGVLIVNADEPATRPQGRNLPRIVAYGLERPADASACDLQMSLRGTAFRMRIDGTEAVVRSRLIGRHNVSNCLAAACAARHFGLSPDEIARGIESLDCVPGRLEPVEGNQPYHIFVDYAHTPDALSRCLAALRPLTVGRLLCVFGAGGDRDRAKRPLMGRAAAAADVAVITSDNPRSEDPERIMSEIAAAWPDHAPPPLRIVDRAEAISRALALADPGDCVVIAGKGHETEQIFGGQRIRFDDREVARRQIHSLQTLSQTLRRPQFQDRH